MPNTGRQTGSASVGDEEKRILALDRYAILDTAPERDFDDLAQLAAQICGAPIGLITFVDGTRQFFKAWTGSEGGSSATLHAGFCPLVVQHGKPVVIPDIAGDPAHAENIAAREGGMRFYAGTPLLTADGYALGTLCALDTVARPRGLQQAQLDALSALARQVMSQLELRRAIAERQQGEQALRQMADAMPQIVWSTDPEGRITSVNKQWTAYTSESSEPGMVADIAGRFVHPDDLASTMAAFEQALRSGDTFEVEHRLRSDSGDYRWFLVRALPHRDPKTGRILRWYGSSTDIHDRTVAECRLASAIEIARLGTFDWNADTGTVTMDVRSRQIFGLPVEGDLRQEDVSACIKPADIERVSTAAKVSLKSGSRVEIDYTVVRPDGSEGAVRSIGDVVAEDPSSRRIVGVFQDITDLKQAETALRTTNQGLELQVAERTAERDMLSTIVESTDVMVMGVALDYTILAINRANADEFERVYGVRPKTGDNILDLLAGQPAHQAQVQTTWGRGLAGEEITIIEDFGDPARIRPFYEIKFRTLRGEQGERIGCYQFVTDVTERLREQTALAKAQEQLRQSQKMEAIGQLTGGLAHDVNNMLQGIGGALQMAQKRIEMGRIGDLPGLMKVGRDAVDRAASLTRGLLAFARRGQLDPKPIIVDDSVRAIADLIRRTVGPGIEVQLELRDGDWAVRLDPTALESALLNLAINARDAMPEGGRLTFSTKEVQLSAAELGSDAEGVIPGGFVLISVADTGTGMPPSVVARAFEPFFTTKPIGKGTGLGLSQLYGFVRQSGGLVRIESQVGLGTTIHLHLPRAEAALLHDEVPTTPYDAAADTPSRTVLVVEDEPTVRTHIVETLRDQGHIVLEAEDGRAGLVALAGSARVDLLVTDVGLPGLNGRQVADAARERRPTLPVLFITGYAGTALNDDLPPGMAAITKPFSLDDFAARVAVMLAAKRD